MKILYSHRTRSADGQYVHIRSLTDALRARGCDVAICGPDDEAEAPRPLDIDDPGAGVKSLLPRWAYELAECSYSVVGYRRLARFARETGFDVLYERYNLFYHAGVRLARSRGLPLIMEVNAPLAEERARHGGLSLKSLARWSEGSLWRAADAVLPVTGVLAEKVAAAGVPAEKITVIQNGVDERFLADLDGAEVRARYGLQDRIVLGFTGFVREWHGAERVLEFMAASGRADLHFLLVGDGTVREALIARAAALGLSDRLTITGIVQREAAPAHVAAFDVALQPAVVDYASPLKLFEYMGLARPILAPDSANIREVLTHGEDALLFDRDDDAAFGRSLGALIGDADLRARLGRAARASLLRRKLTWAHNAERVEAIARRLTEDRP